MIELFNIPDRIIDTSKFNNLLHGDIVKEFENNFAKYVGAKYACSLSSATNAIFLTLLNENLTVEIPAIIPLVVPNAILTSGNKLHIADRNHDWVGESYILYNYGDKNIIDSAQRVDRGQYKNECNDYDIMIFSFYPTKPVSGIDGGMVVSNDKKYIEKIRTLSMNGYTNEINSWDRKYIKPGYKMYMNSVQAYFANESLKELDDNKHKLGLIRDRYNKALGYTNTSDHLYRITVSDNLKVLEVLKKKGIQCGIHYKSIIDYDLFSEWRKKENYSNSDYSSLTTLSIPFHSNLSSQEIDYTIKHLEEHRWV